MGKRCCCKWESVEGKLFKRQQLLGVLGPTEFQGSSFSHREAFEKKLPKFSPLSLRQAPQQVARTPVIRKSNMTAPLPCWGFIFTLTSGWVFLFLLVTRGPTIIILKGTANIARRRTLACQPTPITAALGNSVD